LLATCDGLDVSGDGGDGGAARRRQTDGQQGREGGDGRQDAGRAEQDAAGLPEHGR